MLTHGNCSSVGAMVQEIGFVTDEDVSYLYLPLAHVFALTVQIASFDVGTAIIYFGGDPKQIIAELAETKPTYFPSVPRIFEKLYTMATVAVEQAPAEDQVKFAKAIEVGFQVRELERDGTPVPGDLRAAYEEADARVFPTSARSSAAGCARRCRARLRSRRRSCGSSWPAASWCSRATG